MGLWNLDKALCVETLQGHTSWVSCVAVDWDSRLALSGSRDQTLKLWDLDLAACSATLKGHMDLVRCVSVDWSARVALMTEPCGCGTWTVLRVFEPSRVMMTGSSVWKLTGHPAVPSLVATIAC